MYSWRSVVNGLFGIFIFNLSRLGLHLCLLRHVQDEGVAHPRLLPEAELQRLHLDEERLKKRPLHDITPTAHSCTQLYTT